MYADTGLYSCIGVEIGGQPLGTTISHLTARGRSFNLDVFGGTLLAGLRVCDLQPALTPLNCSSLSNLATQVAY
jgi:hypothetical protein